MSARDEIIAAIGEVQALPSAVADVVAMIQDPQSDLADMARVIEYEPGLTANVLRLANSAYFGAQRQIHSLREAVVRLGIDTVFELVMATAIAPLARPAVRGYDLVPGDLWDHSIAVGLSAVHIAHLTGRPEPRGLFTSGLLVDIGKIVLGTFIDVDPQPILDAAFDAGLAFDAAEREVLGIDHAEVGATLIEQWNLPETMVEVVRCHHRPELAAEPSLAIDLVHAADVCCMMGGIGTGTDGLHYHVCDASVERLQLTTRIVEQVVTEVFVELADVRGMFSGIAA